MFNIIKKELQWGDKTLTLETGKVARQADGAVIATMGSTKVLCTVVFQKDPKPGIDFFPLTCVYQEKTFAAGKIPGGFFKREGRPSEKETLTSRLIDRPIRPLFEDGFANETQIICTVIQFDGENDPDIVSMVGASAALAISGAPFNGPIAAARIAYINGEYDLNPFMGFEEESDLDLIVAGTESSVMMVESEAKELSEEIMLGAVKFAHEQMQPVIKAINELAEECGKERFKVEKPDHSEAYAEVKELAEAGLRKAYGHMVKQNRSNAISETKADTIAKLEEKHGEAFDSNLTSGLLKKLEKEIVRGDLLENGKRIDGREPADVRQIESEVGFLPQTHGSALFTRGETQALVVTTLGTGEDEQMIDALEGKRDEHFMLHYNFPPYSVGEAQMLRGPGRREIGHGKLAWRALHALLPSKDDFPYTIRIVSEITESNGSSSMATVCGSSLAMMDAGVPLKRPCSGIAMGLVLEEDRFVVLSDIMGDEDHLGDMDFKVAGTEEGITSLQMDIKVEGITTEIMDIALQQANEGRLHILKEMEKALDKPREDVNESAPKITAIKIDPDKIREVIGSGGKVIREIVEESGAKVDIEDDGTIRIAAVNGNDAQKAIDMINDIVAEPEVGAIYEDCEVVKIMDFGAFVQFMGKNQGLVHISELTPERVDKVTDVVQEGDKVKVKLHAIDKQGRVKLSMRMVDQETGEDISDQFPPKEDRPRRKKAS